MFGFIKKNRQIDSFANELATKMYSNIPELSTWAGLGSVDKKQKKRLDYEINRTTQSVLAFKDSVKLGVYSKARFHMEFSERLKTIGVNGEVVEFINKTLLLNTP